MFDKISEKDGGFSICKVNRECIALDESISSSFNDSGELFKYSALMRKQLVSLYICSSYIKDLAQDKTR